MVAEGRGWPVSVGNGGGATGSTGPGGGAKRNLLWIMVDQMRADALGFMGNGIVRTPNLDALAERGVVFERAMSQCPLCTPARASLFTGRYVHSHGAWWNGMPVTGDRTLMPEIMMNAGYDTAVIGKLHLHPTDASHGFDHKELHEERLEPELSAYGAFLADHGYEGKTPRDFTEWENRITGICRMPEELEETRWVADRTDAYLANRSEGDDRPFFLFSSFLRPHTPFNPLPRFAELYRGVDVGPPAFTEEERVNLPPRIRTLAEVKGWDRFTTDDWIQMRKYYYALCTQVDEAVGRVLESLERHGYAEHTVIVFTTDHGEFAGDHALIGKGHPWETAVHVPLLVYDPESKTGATRVRDLVELVDVMPSLLDLLEIETPDTVQGRSFADLIKANRSDGAGATTRRYAFSESMTHSIDAQANRVLEACGHPYLISVRSDRYKYIRYTDEPGELYDLESDPDERNNLFGAPGTGEIVSEHESAILDWLVRTNDFQRPVRGNTYFSGWFDSLDSIRASL